MKPRLEISTEELYRHYLTGEVGVDLAKRYGIKGCSLYARFKRAGLPVLNRKAGRPSRLVAHEQFIRENIHRGIWWLLERLETSERGLREFIKLRGLKPSKKPERKQRLHRDLVGHKFQQLTVLRFVGLDKFQCRTWVLKCDCGRECVRTTATARSVGHCGCLTKLHFSESSTTHGQSQKQVYKAWASMKGRCNNPNNTHYSHYGGRGISVCERWLSFENFISDMGDRPIGATIERKDTNGNYTPANCVWATRKEQQRNRRCNRLLTVDGVTKCLSAWSERYVISGTTIIARINAGWPVAEAVKTPPNPKHRNGLSKCLTSTK